MKEDNALRILDSTFRYLDIMLAEEKRKRDRQTADQLPLPCHVVEKSAVRQVERETEETATK
jgi:hypothetical protein